MFKQKLRPNWGGQHYGISVSTLPEPIPPTKNVKHFPTVEMALWAAEAWSQREHLVPVSPLKRAEGCTYEVYLEKERIMTEERRNREIRQGNQNIRGSDKAVNIGQVV